MAVVTTESQKQVLLEKLPVALISAISSFGDLEMYVAFASASVFLSHVSRLAASSPYKICLPRDVMPSHDSPFWSRFRPHHLVCMLQFPDMLLAGRLDRITLMVSSLRVLHLEGQAAAQALDVSFVSLLTRLESLRAPDHWCNIRNVPLPSSLTEIDVDQCSAATALLLLDAVGLQLQTLRIEQLMSGFGEPEDVGICTIVWRTLLARCTHLTKLVLDWTFNMRALTDVVTAMPHLRTFDFVLQPRTALELPPWTTLRGVAIKGPPACIHRLLRSAPQLESLEWYAYSVYENATAERDGVGMAPHLEPTSVCKQHSHLAKLAFFGFKFDGRLPYGAWARTLLADTEDGSPKNDGVDVLLTAADGVSATAARHEAKIEKWKATSIELPALRDLEFEGCVMQWQMPSLPPNVHTLALKVCEANAHDDRKWMYSAALRSLTLDLRRQRISGFNPLMVSDVPARFPALTELYICTDTVISPVPTISASLSELVHLHTLVFTCEYPAIVHPPDTAYYLKLIRNLPQLRTLRLNESERHSRAAERHPQHTRAWRAAQQHIQNVLDQRS